MVAQVLNRDLSNLVEAAIVNTNGLATAGGAGNNVARTGLTIDRNAYGVALGAMVAIAYTAVLGATNTLTIRQCQVEHSPDGSAWSVLRTFPDPGVVATGPAGGGTVNSAVLIQLDLKSANRYVRFDYTPQLSAASVDTCNSMPIAIMHGHDRYPPPSSAV